MDRMSRMTLSVVVLAALATLVSGIASTWRALQPAAPPQCSPEVTVAMPEPAALTRHGEFDTDTGTFMAYPDDVVPEQDFIRDCRSVCTRPDSGYHSPTDESSNSEPSRVLYMDPPHMICACFRPDNGPLGQVERYVAWRRGAR